MAGHRALIIPAAGLGRRLQAEGPKALVPVNGRAALDHLLLLYGPFVDRIVVVVHPSGEAAIRRHCERVGAAVVIARQERPTGMLDAILAPLSRLSERPPARIWVTWCDQVAIHPATVRELARLSDEQPPPALAFPTVPQPNPYIHVVRTATGRITAILQRREADPMPPVGESDMGLFSLAAESYFDELPLFARESGAGSATGERNFLPFIPWLSSRGADVRTFACRDAREAIGVNTVADLRAVERYLVERDQGSLAAQAL